MNGIYYEVTVEQEKDKSYVNENGERIQYNVTDEIVGKFKYFEDVDGFVYTVMNHFENVTVNINIKKEEK